MSRLHRIVENYEARLRLEAEGRLTEQEITDRVRCFSITAAYEDQVLSQTREVLCAYGVPTILFVPYHAFSRELGKLTREMTSLRTLQSETAWRVDKWVMRGLAREVLRGIACQVFNISTAAKTAD